MSVTLVSFWTFMFCQLPPFKAWMTGWRCPCLVGVECCSIGWRWTSVAFLFSFVFWLRGDKIGRSGVMQDTCVIEETFSLLFTINRVLWRTEQWQWEYYYGLPSALRVKKAPFIYLFLSIVRCILLIFISSVDPFIHLISFLAFHAGLKGLVTISSGETQGVLFYLICAVSRSSAREPLPTKTLHWPWAYVNFYMRLGTLKTKIYLSKWLYSQITHKISTMWFKKK